MIRAGSLPQLIGLTALLFVLGCADKPDADPDRPDRSSDKKAKTTKSRPTEPIRSTGKAEPNDANGNADGPKIVKMIALDFGREWLADKEGTAKKYAKKTLELTGTISEFMVDLKRRPTALIPCENKEKRPLLLSVLTKNKEPWSVVGLGQTVTVRGRLEKGQFQIPFLHEAEFVNPGSSPSIKISAKDLAAEAAKDWQATVDKYKGKGLIVTGKVVKRNEDGSVAYLEGGDGRMIRCYFVPVIKPALGAPLKENEETRIFGIVYAYASDEKDVVLKFDKCLPILQAR